MLAWLIGMIVRRFLASRMTMSTASVTLTGVVGVWVRLFYADPPAPVFTLRRHRDTPTRLPRVVELVLTERAKHGVGSSEGD